MIAGTTPFCSTTSQFLHYSQVLGGEGCRWASAVALWLVARWGTQGTSPPAAADHTGLPHNSTGQQQPRAELAVSSGRLCSCSSLACTVLALPWCFLGARSWCCVWKGSWDWWCCGTSLHTWSDLVATTLYVHLNRLCFFWLDLGGQCLWSSCLDGSERFLSGAAIGARNFQDYTRSVQSRASSCRHPEHSQYQGVGACPCKKAEGGLAWLRRD